MTNIHKQISSAYFLNWYIFQVTSNVIRYLVVSRSDQSGFYKIDYYDSWLFVREFEPELLCLDLLIPKR